MTMSSTSSTAAFESRMAFCVGTAVSEPVNCHLRAQKKRGEERETGKDMVKLVWLAWDSALHMMMSSVSRVAAVISYLPTSCDNITDPCLGGIGEESSDRDQLLDWMDRCQCITILHKNGEAFLGEYRGSRIMMSSTPDVAAVIFASGTKRKGY